MARRTGNTVAKIVSLLLAIAVGLALRLILPGTPGPSKALAFQGYILLPNDRVLNILDYLSVDNGSLYVADESGGSVAKIALHGLALPGKADEALLAGRPATHGVVVDPASHMAFVSRSAENTVDVFDPAAMHIVASVPVADDPDGIFYDPYTRQIYVASGDGNMGTLIDPAQRSVVAAINLGGKPEFAALDTTTHLLMQNLESTNELLSVDLAKHQVVGRRRLDGCEAPTGMAVDNTARRLFIACSANAKLAVLDLRNFHTVQTLPIGSGPDAIVYDAGLHRVYTAGRSGVTSVVQQDSPDVYRVVDTVKTHYGAHTLTVDPSTHRVYIGYASLLVAPRIAVFDALP